MKLKISSRAVLDLLAGRGGLEQFRRAGLCARDGERNLFENLLAQGMTLSAVSLEYCGPDADDDYFVFEFADDPAAREFTAPASPNEHDDPYPPIVGDQ